MSISQLKSETKYKKTKIIRGRDYEAKAKYSDLNQRIVVESYSGTGLNNLGNRLKGEAKSNEYGKIWVKVRFSDHQQFSNIGFIAEGLIEDYYLDEAAIIMAFYPDSERSRQQNREKKDQIVADLLQEESDQGLVELDDDCEFKIAEPSDITAMTELYKEVFTSYPTPIFKKEYIEESMNSDVIYGLLYDGEDLVAAASAETNPEFKNAEMTDFATLPSARGNGYASYILNKLESELKARRYHSLYSIARSTSYGMNKVFKEAEYEYNGRLIQNCHIAGGFEDMNLWCKVLNNN
ncbi:MULTISPECIES: putative beta-lysine N-acetyltransferase [unclassified Candidatus Frackibacter]|uniref:putative beta-lysine N-acetyltransferase n=1 Tax=unclassified Candidatus Frackibacter TaxID=2648818 RepID=UPI000884702C|nr:MULTISPECIES: putative beta-lysine N-acetyltransferase [unclassified Candidatus Frackibacter]SDC58115.1 putative beta-lysine N-acetyltransferase [Candidatus Frackibacter sp. WG11]SEM72166.1 putative beta-lysine N-acetyltransferase [Candidatus Frackibacter sp. WG12]SFL82059.1 putative beta-lysine N-acetyltransferase [Candidatus Frackibacter sp. WG13]